MAGGYIRRPRVIVSTDGGDLVPLQCTVHVTQHQSADTFHATLALDGPGNLDEGYWADTAPINVTIQATNDQLSGGYVTMFTGAVDKVSVSFDHRTVQISGRDKTAKMTDKKTNEKWLNKKPEEIIEDLAGRAGLGVQFSGQSMDKAGLKYKDDYNRISELDNYWNVITRLAKQMGCIAFVKQDTLYVQPYDTATGGTYPIVYQRPLPGVPAQSNVVSLTCDRNLNLSKTMKLTHKSWQHKEGKAIKSKYQLSGQDSDELDYEFKAANLTKAQQDQLAQTKLDEIASHERNVTVHTAGDVNISPLMELSLSGTGTAFDQSYIISNIEHDWSFDGGYKMHINVRHKDKKRGNSTQAS